MTLPSFEVAKCYLEDPFACFQLQTISKHISLLPRYIGCLRTGIQDILDADLKQFSEEIGGVLVAYDNIRRLQPGGMIFEELCHLHFDINVDVIVFKPTVGCLLKAEVNKLTDTHVGCLVHNCFNASISKPSRLNSEDWQGSQLVLGEEFILEVSKILSQNGLIFIRGNIANERLPREKSKKKKKKKRRLSDHTDDDLSEDYEPSHKKHKKELS